MRSQAGFMYNLNSLGQQQQGKNHLDMKSFYLAETHPRCETSSDAPASIPGDRWKVMEGGCCNTDPLYEDQIRWIFEECDAGSSRKARTLKSVDISGTGWWPLLDHIQFLSQSAQIKFPMMRNRIWKKKRCSNSSFHRYSRNQMRSCYNNAHAAQWVAACSCTWHLTPDSLISTMIKKLWNLISFFQNKHVYSIFRVKIWKNTLSASQFKYCGHIYCER